MGRPSKVGNRKQRRAQKTKARVDSNLPHVPSQVRRSIIESEKHYKNADSKPTEVLAKYQLELKLCIQAKCNSLSPDRQGRCVCLILVVGDEDVADCGGVSIVTLCGGLVLISLLISNAARHESDCAVPSYSHSDDCDVLVLLFLRFSNSC